MDSQTAFILRLHCHLAKILIYVIYENVLPLALSKSSTELSKPGQGFAQG